MQEHLQKIYEKYEAQDYKKSYELIKHLLKHTTYSLEILIVKLKCEEALNKYDEALKTANFVLWIWPNNLECHQSKLRILQNLSKFNHLTDCLILSKTLFPNISFN